MRLVLCSGARSLGDTSSATQWAKRVIASVLRPGDWGICGDACGVDTWFREHYLATIPAPRLVVYCVDGTKRIWLDGDEHPPQSWLAEATDAQRVMRQDPKRRPLARNATMVARAKLTLERLRTSDRYVCEGGVCLALRSPWSATNGTAHTMSLAAAAGFAVEEHICPMAYSPGTVFT